jgi:hypothetical protein
LEREQNACSLDAHLDRAHHKGLPGTMWMPSRE